MRKLQIVVRELENVEQTFISHRLPVANETNTVVRTDVKRVAAVV
jgi:hypothetical protein